MPYIDPFTVCCIWIEVAFILICSSYYVLCTKKFGPFGPVIFMFGFCVLLMAIAELVVPHGPKFHDKTVDQSRQASIRLDGGWRL